MKQILFAALALVAGTAAANVSAVGEAAVGVELEQVDHIPALGRMHSWYALDNESLIIWASAFDPYLVRLSHPSPGMRFARTIGVTESVGRVHSRFDSVLVEGFRYRIDGIYKISVEDAKALKAEAAR